jgi:hypothetical protein
VSAYDPLLDGAATAATGAAPWTWGVSGRFQAIVSQTADPRFASLDPAWFPDLRVVFDGRNSLRELALPPGVAYRGVGAPARSPLRGGASGE